MLVYIHVYPPSQLKLNSALISQLQASPKLGGGGGGGGGRVVRNVKTLMVYHTLSGLRPLLGAPSERSEQTRPARLMGYVRVCVCVCVCV